ncbi:MAG: acyl carrier protein [Chloroflexi bacterium]|jgi:acyl carrier protein|uniref:Acyl carrier protein n=1 Tax=Candidatus Chlorohelix allophototropha TaxID=3003348 RepID=A0A8T7M8X9_9CHLR|nr:acyl carrier protein [Chloroflexota bacterium]WJW68510.1 acyl carrier protein [Chloroflexota bacterium L227-S17]
MAATGAIFDKLKDIIVEQLAVDAEDVTIEASFIEDLNADSLDLVELIMEIEEKFGIQVPDEVAEKIATVGDAVDYIQEHQE